ncbi:MAG: isocitrate lyase/PEP mutase family protein, partial [Pseudomonadales bacterium]
MTRLIDRLKAGAFISAPGVFDPLSARVAEQSGATALYMTGYGVSASLLGKPDAGLVSYREMVDRVRLICDVTEAPLIADGDTGFGGLANVRQAVQGYEAAGASAIQIEDQEYPKRCGHTKNRKVIPAEDMVKKIEIATESRSSDDFLIVARTDARTEHGLDEALRRSEAYIKAGADILFLESPESVEEMRVITERFPDIPKLANMVGGGKTPVLPDAELRALGYQIVIHPV